MEVDADESSSSRPRRSGAEPDRITRFASPNRFDSLDAPVSFLDRRSSPGTVGASSRGTVHSNMDAITRGAVPERCISSDLLIGSRTGQAYRTSHSATMKPTLSSTTQSLPVRNRSALMRQDRLKDGTGTVPRQAFGHAPLNENARLSKLTASVQRLLADREAERRAISRQQFELQIGARSGSEGNVGESPIRPSSAQNQHCTPPQDNAWSPSGKFQAERISQELVNDFFSSPLSDTPGYGDFGLAVTKQSEQEVKPLDVKIPERAASSNDSQPPASPTSLPSPNSVALEDSHPEISKLEAKVRTRNLIHTEPTTTAKRLSLTDRARNTLSLELPEAVFEEGAETSADTNGVEENPEFLRQLDDLAGRMGLVQRRPSVLSKSRCDGAPKLADESYKEATAARHMSAPESSEGKGKKPHRRALSGSGLLASFWRHFSPRLSRRGRRSLAAEPGGRQKAKSDGGTENDSKTKGSGEWDSVSTSSQKQRPGSAASGSSCPSPEVFAPPAASEWVQPSVNRQVMASIERDRIRDPYQSFKSRAQQQQQQQTSGDSPVISRPSQLSINSSTPSSTGSAPRINSCSKSSAESVTSSTSQSSPGPRYINVSLAAYGYGLPYNPTSPQRDPKATQSVLEGHSDCLQEPSEGAQDRLSCPPALDSQPEAFQARANAPETVREMEQEEKPQEMKGDERAEVMEEERAEEEKPKATDGQPEERGDAAAERKVESGSSEGAMTNGHGGQERPKAEREAAEEAKVNGTAERTTGTARPATLPTDGNTSPVARRRSKTMPRTPSSPLNRSFDAQTAARSSLIMLAVGHASPRPKSVSVSVADSEGLEEETRADNEDESSDGPRDGRHFLRVVDHTEREIRCCIASTEADLAAQGEVMSDEVSGILRTAVGKATLLVSDKFAQFRGLCEENLAANAVTPYATRSSDLEGFWAMVELQVDDVRRMFKEIRQLRGNAWRLPEPERPSLPAPEPARKPARPATSAAAPKRPSASANTAAKRPASAAREEARRRLLAAKREALAKRKAAQESGAAADVIFV